MSSKLDECVAELRRMQDGSYRTCVFIGSLGRFEFDAEELRAMSDEQLKAAIEKQMRKEQA